jgi:hypothetical protein
MSLKTEVTRGVFDPRTYQEADPVNWARKRRSDWLAIPGKIHYVRERTVDSEEREVDEEDKKEEERQKAAEEKTTEGAKQDENIIEKKQTTEFWPRKKRSDITMSRYVY